MKTNVKYLFRLEAKKVVPIKKTDLIEVHGREWFDKINGNSYHCVYISINGSLVITVPFQYGYGDSYIQSATQALNEAGYIDTTNKTIANYYLVDRWARENGIHCVCHIQRGCKKNQLPTMKSLGL